MASSAIVRVIFDWALDGAAWPGPLHGKEFAFGEAWLGPRGLIDLLEVRLGLRGLLDGSLARVSRLAARLRGGSGYWADSFNVDPLGTARRLLQDRDELRLWGWQGQPVSPRLKDLHAATTDMSPGLPDRLDAICHVLGKRKSIDIRSIVSHTSIARLPPLWRRLFDGLRGTGVLIEEPILEPAPAVGDLATGRSPKFTPAGDGRLCLLRRHGPLDLADEVAAALAACDNLDGVVIVGADGVLDQALMRQGLPRVGAHVGATASSRLLGLVIETAFAPMEISSLHALLAADPGPIPRAIAARLIRALHQFPGRRTEEWTEAVAKGIDALEEEKREGAEQRVKELLLPACARTDSIPVAVLRARLESLDGWARARGVYQPSLLALSGAIHTLLEAVELMDPGSLSLSELRRLCEDLGEPTWSWAPAQAGLAHVGRPAAILGPARTILWWNFSRETAQRPRRLRMTRQEREGLAAVGAEAPDPTPGMGIDSDGWRRPLQLARDSLVLACPMTNEVGEANHPHPLWDEVTGALADPRDARKLERDRMAQPALAKLTPVTSRQLAGPVPSVKVQGPIALRKDESPSSIETLVGCSMKWALHYQGRVEPGLSSPPPQPGPLLFGKLAHRMLEQVLNQEWPSGDDAARRAEAVFDRQCDELCEDLALPQHQSVRATLRLVVVETARWLGNLAVRHGARGIHTELECAIPVQDLTIRGHLDLVWDTPPVVLDLKWGKSTQWDKLENGTALQLGAYSAMRASGGAFPETAYFSLVTQELLAEPGGRLQADGQVPGQHRAPDVWKATVAALKRRRAELNAGQLEAPHAAGDEVEAQLAGGDVRIAPPCKYCSFGALCGRTGAR